MCVWEWEGGGVLPSLKLLSAYPYFCRDVQKSYKFSKSLYSEFTETTFEDPLFHGITFRFSVGEPKLFKQITERLIKPD